MKVGWSDHFLPHMLAKFSRSVPISTAVFTSQKCGEFFEKRVAQTCVFIFFVSDGFSLGLDPSPHVRTTRCFHIRRLRKSPFPDLFPRGLKVRL